MLAPNKLQQPKHIPRDEHASGTELEAKGQRVVGWMQRQPPRVSSEPLVESHVPRLDQLLTQIDREIDSTE